MILQRKHDDLQFMRMSMAKSKNKSTRKTICILPSA
jgi:hypothetical protein